MMKEHKKHREIEIPNNKFQITNNFQSPNSKDQNKKPISPDLLLFFCLGFGAWNL